ncbi:MAG: cytochrome c3 family protein [Hyphomicrobiales bacterium]
MRSHRGLLIGLAVAAAAIVIAAGLYWKLHTCSPCEPDDRGPIEQTRAEEKPNFVGTETCISCHAEEGRLWHASQHAHAMAHASNDTVLGDFDGATFDYGGVTSRFFKKDGKFFVETDGPDGTLDTFEVKYTFGLEPLQQYLIEFPDGRIQALSIAWDTRPKEQGGQRWFHLYPDETIAHDDPLHWTKLNQNWNFMCAECHSTGVVKNYDAANDSFATSWKEISIGCEACHGQGSAHVAWAKSGAEGDAKDVLIGLLARFDERAGVTWHRDANTGQPMRSAAPAILREEVEMCGRCHARRGQISEDWIPGHPLSDSHVVSMLSNGLYQPDGQMLDEVYNYGSFKESKMFAAGVTCSDCHNPHSGKLVASGNQVCLQCHAPSYAQTSHTHHEGQAHRPASPATCRRARIWLSIRAMTIRSVCRVRISRLASASTTPAPHATRTNRRNGPLRRSPTGSVPTAKVYRPMRRRSMPPGMAGLTRRRFSGASPAMPTCRPLSAPAHWKS